jgi:hypothetical protein
MGQSSHSTSHRSESGDHPKLLSICIVARNDNFHGDYKYRLSTCLNFLAKGLAGLGRIDDVEVIVADWGSDVPLHKELVLLPPARDLIRFLVIPPDLAKQRQGDADFGYSFALNAAIRRSRGEFAAELSADVLLTGPSLESLLSVLEGVHPGIPTRQALFPILRRQLHMCQAKRRPSLRELDEYLLRNMVLLPVDAMGCGYGWASGFVMHRPLWDASRGYDERMLNWGWADIDFALRLTQRYPVVDLANFGVCGIHLQHYFQTPNDPVFRQRKTNPPYDTPQFTANQEDWGLGGVDLEFCCLENVSDEEPADETSRVGTPEPWDLTARQLVEQLTAPALQQQVQTMLRAINVEPASMRPSTEDASAFLALAWHAQRRGVRAYVEAGMRVPYGACLVARNSPGVELYMIVDWHDSRMQGGSYELFSNNLIKGLGQHWGYMRFVGDDPATGVQRVSQSTGSRFAVDLALVRASAQLPHAPQQAVELANFLTPGGAIVVTADNEPNFRNVWSALTASRPQLTYLRFADHRSGLALAATLTG